MAVRRPGESVGDEKGGERRRQPEERRRLQIDPEAERRHAFSHAPTRRLTRRKTPTVAISVATVETTSAAASARPWSRRSPRYCTTPTPAGTNRSGKRGEKSARRLPEVARRERLLVERPPAPEERERDDEQRKPDHRAGGGKREPARHDFADELKNKQDEETADHGACLSPEADAKVNAAQLGGLRPVFVLCRMMPGGCAMSETRKIAAILVSDVVGYSRLAGADEDRTLARLRALRSDLIDPTISVHHGRIVKRTGDGSVIEFRSVVDAVRCAVEVQHAMVERNAGVALDKRIEFRIGIHLGDVVEESDGDLMGDGVNIAARLEGIAGPGAICLSEDAYRQVSGRLDHGGHGSRPDAAQEHRKVDPGLFAASRRPRPSETRNRGEAAPSRKSVRRSCRSSRGSSRSS